MRAKSTMQARLIQPDLLLHQLPEAFSMSSATSKHKHHDQAAVGGGIYISKAAVGHTSKEEESIICCLAKLCSWLCLQGRSCQAAQHRVESGCIWLDGCLWHQCIVEVQ